RSPAIRRTRASRRSTTRTAAQSSSACWAARSSSRRCADPVPKVAATHRIDAPRELVWAIVADPERFGEWWPGVASVEPGRRGLVPGARWRIEGESRGRYLRRPLPAGELLVLEVRIAERVAFQLTGDRIDVELVLRDDEGSTTVELVVEAPPLIGMRRAFPGNVLRALDAAAQR